MPDSVCQGEFLRFLQKHHFSAKGKHQTLYLGIFDGSPRVVTFHYHKDHDEIPTGTLSALARQLGLEKKDLVTRIKGRS